MSVHPSVRLSVCVLRYARPYFRFGTITQFLRDIYADHTSIIVFLDDTLSKYQWIFTKPDMFIYIRKIVFANGQVLSFFTGICIVSRL